MVKAIPVNLKNKSIYFIVGAFLIGAILGFLFNHQSVHVTSTNGTSSIVRQNSPNYKFINPLLLSNSTSNTPSSQYNNLLSNINTYVQNAWNSPQVTDVSVYIRDMNNGLWTGVNGNDLYAPGSMLKVAIMMGYLNAAQNNPDILNQKFYYNPQIDEGQYFKPPQMLAAGYYTATDLIKNMIIESDNTATLILANQHPDIVTQVYKDLHLPDAQAGVDFMSPIEYAEFWRVLYNSTYLPHETSEEALTLLSYTTFNDGLVAGLPSGIRVAHKFGEHTDVYTNKPTVHELHDCGIVYPNNKDPYFICVMTRGTDFAPLEKVISDISKMTYQYMSS